MEAHIPDEDELLRSVASQNAQSILAARQRAEQEILRAKEALEGKTRELAESLAMMRATLESTWDGILVTDPSGNVIGFNQKMLDMWHIPGAVLEARRHRDVVEFCAGQFADEDRRRYRLRIEEIYAASSGESFDLLELSDGRVFERYSRVQSVEGRNAGRVWSFRDITHYRRSEEALREETRTLELLHKAVTTLSSTLDLQALLQAVTDAATELSGARFGAFFYNTTDVHGDAFMLYTLSGAPREAFARFGQPRTTPLLGPTFRGEGPIRSDDVLQDPRYGRMPPHAGMPPGHLPVRSYLAVPVVSRTGEVIGGLFFGHPDVGVFTERAERLVVGVAAHAAVAVDNARLYEARRELLESERSARGEAERASAMKDEFLATVSHELRTPLNAILGWVRILRARPGSEADLRHALEVMERNASIQIQLIEDLLDMSRITSGKMRLDVRPLNPIAFVEAAIQTVAPAAEAKGIRLHTELDPAAGPITGDPNRLQQVVWNLLSNAIKFTRANGRIEVVLRRLNAQVEIVVADTGRRHQAPVAAARLRSVPAGRFLAYPSRRRARARAFHREASRRAARRDRACHQSGRGPGCNLHDPAAPRGHSDGERGGAPSPWGGGIRAGFQGIGPVRRQGPRGGRSGRCARSHQAGAGGMRGTGHNGRVGR